MTGYETALERPTQLTEVTFPHGTAADLAAVKKNARAMRVLSGALGKPASELRFSLAPEGRGFTVGSDHAQALRVPPAQEDTPADFVTHHNQSLDAWARAKKRGEIGNDNVLLHIDTHSDLYNQLRAGDGIADYINRAVIDGTVGEVYWVVPSNLPATGDAGFDVPVALAKAPPYDFQIWVTPDGTTEFEEPEPSVKERSREVAVRVRTIENLEAAKLSQARNVLLDIDVDYFSNLGADTNEKFGSNPSTADLATRLNRVGDTLRDLRPAYTTMCRSPEFSAPEDQQTANDFLRQWFPRNDSPEAVGAYTHGNEPRDDRVWVARARTAAERGDRKFDGSLQRDMVARGYEDAAKVYQEYCAGRVGRDT